MEKPDPESHHCFTENVGTVCTLVQFTVYTNTGWFLLVVRCVCAGMRESLTEVISKSLSKLATQSEGGETVIDETLLS